MLISIPTRPVRAGARLGNLRVSTTSTMLDLNCHRANDSSMATLPEPAGLGND